MTHQLFQLPKQTQIDSSVRVVPGAKAYFFETLTTTPQDTYTTAARNVAHPHPVEADANGVFPAIYLDPTLQYKLTLNTAADVLIYTVDPVNDQILSGTIIGEALWPMTAEEVSAGITIRSYAYPPHNLLRYATGDASTDDTAAIQAVINMISYGETIFVPALPTGKYFKITDDLTLPASKTLNIVGESPTNSRIHQATAGKSVFVSAATFASSAQNMIIRDLYLTASSGLYGIKLRGNSRSAVTGLNFDGFTSSSSAACVFVEDTLILSFIDCRFKNSYNGIRSETSANTAWNGGGCTNCMFEGLTGFGVLADYLNGLAFVGCTIEACGLGGFKVYNGGGAIDFSACYFEENKTLGSAGAVPYFDIYIGANSYINGGSIHGCLFNGNGGIARGTDDYVPIRIKFARGWEIAGNMLNTGSNFVAFDNSAVVENMTFGKLGFHTEQGASFDKSTASTATYHNLPTGHAFFSYGNSIEGLSRINGLISQQYVRAIEINPILGSWSSAATGTGATTADGRGTYVESGSTAASTARASISALGLSLGLGQASVNYASTVEIVGDFMVSNIASGTSTGNSWLMLTTASVAADPSTRSVGFKIVQDAIWGLTHDGTTLNLVNLSTSLSSGVLTQLRFVKSGGSVLWYVNGILKGSTATNVAASTATGLLCMSVANGANAAQQRLGVYDAKFTVTQ